MREGIAEVFRRQADSCRRLGSPFHGVLCALFAERMEPDAAFTRRIDAWSETRAHPDALPLRAVGGLHALVRRGDALAAFYPPHASDGLWDAVRRCIAENDAFLTAFLDSPPQTNEVGRSGILLGAALRLPARPLSWFEIGASAGLNLSFLEYRYRVGYGDPTSPVEIPTTWEANAPTLAPLNIVERAGCDVAPIDPRTDRERLLAYIWPDQHERIARTEAALAIAANAPWKVERAPASAWLARTLPHAKAFPIVVHTIVWQYLPKDERLAIEATLAQHDCARISVEGDGDPQGAAVSITHYPSGERTLIGRADFHGRWVSWS